MKPVVKMAKALFDGTGLVRREPLLNARRDPSTTQKRPSVVKKKGRPWGEIRSICREWG